MADYVRVNLSIDSEVLSRIDKYVHENGLTRSAFMTFASDQFIKAKSIEPELKNTLENLASSFESLSRKVDEINAKN